MADQQSILTKLAPKQTDEIVEQLDAKNAMSVVLNRLRDIESKTKALHEEATFLRAQIEQFFE